MSNESIPSDEGGRVGLRLRLASPTASHNAPTLINHPFHYEGHFNISGPLRGQLWGGPTAIWGGTFVSKFGV